MQVNILCLEDWNGIAHALVFVLPLLIDWMPSLPTHMVLMDTGTEFT